MSTAGAGGIVLVGVGVLLLNLAYSGKGKAVWDALRGSGATDGGEPTPAVEPAPGQDGAQDTGGKKEVRRELKGSVVIIYYDDGSTKTVPASQVGGGHGTVNPNGYNPTRIL